MTVDVIRRIPNGREGVQGETRLLLSGRGVYLYIKAGNQWHSLSMGSTLSETNTIRKGKGDLQRDILSVADENSDGTYDGDGNIMDPSFRGGAAPPDAPH